MKKILTQLKDIYILVFIFSLLYVAFNFSPIFKHIYGVFSLYQNSEIVENINYEEKSSNNINNNQTFLLYDNSNEIKKSKEYTSFRWENIMNNVINSISNLKDNKIELNKVEESIIKNEIEENNIKEINNNTENDFFSLSSELTEEEKQEYWETSYVVIPKIGVKAPIFYPDIELENLEKEILKILEQWVVHRPETQMPYQKWNFFILWHSSNFPWIKSEYNNVFAKIDLLELWDIAYIYYKNRKYVYELYEKKIVDQNEISVYWYIPWRNMSIMTCYPIWSIKNRMIAKFNLIIKNN